MNSTPARRREASLWGLHHHVGYGFRQWRRRSGAPDKEVYDIARVATESIKEVICSRSASEAAKWPPWRTMQKPHMSASNESNKRVGKGSARSHFVDGMAPEDQKGTFEARSDELELAARTQMVTDEFRLAASAQPGPTLQIPSETECLPKRTLRAHVSDESTCLAPSSIEDQGDSEAEADSCSDSCDREPTGPRMKHTRKPRKGRRSKAKARREHWEETKRNEFLDSQMVAQGELGGRALFGALLTCFEEDGWGEHTGGDCDSSFSGHADAHDDEQFPLPAAPPGQSAQTLEQASDEEEMEDQQRESESITRPHKRRKTQSSQTRLGEPEEQLDEETIEAPRRPNMEAMGQEPQAVAQERETQDLDGRPRTVMRQALAPTVMGSCVMREHPLLDEVKEGARLLPTGVAEALNGFLRAANCCTWDSSHALEEDIGKIKAHVTCIEDALSDAENWTCPRHLEAAWEGMKAWLEQDEYGPFERLQRCEDLYEDVKEQDVATEAAQEELMFNLSFVSRGMDECREGILDKIHDIAYANAREEYRRSNARGTPDFSALPAEDIQAMISKRLGQSLSSR